MVSNKGLFELAAVFTATAGILHLVRAPLKPHGFPAELVLYAEVLFIVGGILQIFWVLPMIRHWGRPWYIVGVIGTAVFMAFWIISRVPNPITGVALPNNVLGYATEAVQSAFIVVTLIIIAKEKTIIQVINQQKAGDSTERLTSLSNEVTKLRQEIDILKNK
ncbi:MAG: rane protein of unknown function [Nitrososphaeraceae archaeon]|jgi:hypothetical protein|nr:rane protein of unknown function [Nitrososphaeraceae archaeon]MDF2769854.1 rane protein of unknown function [Nitrososphaeraceae archaeon]